LRSLGEECGQALLPASSIPPRVGGSPNQTNPPAVIVPNPPGSGIQSASSNTSSNATVQTNCCNYFEAGAGYEFSVCDGIGAIIRADLIGGARDLAWANMSDENSQLSSIYQDLSSLVDNYCDTRSLRANTTNGTVPLNVSAEIWQQLDIPWAEWGQDLLV